MDNASDFESEDCEFESRRGQNLFLKIYVQQNTHTIMKKKVLPHGVEPWIFGLRDRRLTTWPRKLMAMKILITLKNDFLFGSNLHRLLLVYLHINGCAV